MILNDEFDMMYDDWMIMDSIKMKKSYSAKLLFQCVKKIYSDTDNDTAREEINYLYEKALVLHQKLLMMLYAEYNLHKVKSEFEISQNMEFPVLYGMEKTIILFYLESMIVFARNALDIAATIYSNLFFNKRMDSFNDFSKRIISSDNVQFKELKEHFTKHTDDGVNAYRLLCGSSRGRALRDIIIHQANVKLMYDEYKEYSEKERLFLVLKDEPPIDLDELVCNFIGEVDEIFRVTTECCENLLRKES